MTVLMGKWTQFAVLFAQSTPYSRGKALGQVLGILIVLAIVFVVYQ